MEKYLKTLKSLITLLAYALVLIWIFDIVIKTVFKALVFTSTSGLGVVTVILAIIYKDKFVGFLKTLNNKG